MPDFELYEQLLAAMALGMSLLGASLSVARLGSSAAHALLFAFFSLNALTELESVISPQLAPIEEVRLTPLMITVTLALPSLLWCYVCELTTDGAPGRAWRDWRPWVPVVFAAGVALALGAQSDAVLLSLFTDAPPSGEAVETPLHRALIAVLLLWGLQIVWVYGAVLRRLVRYRLRLRQLYASTEHRELGWITALMSILGAMVAITLVDIFVDLSPLLDLGDSALNLAMIWILAQWGLRQQPGIWLADRRPDAADSGPTAPEVEAAAEDGPKYERSALDAEQRARIAAKIAAAMDVQQLYLQPNLSLGELARAIAVPPNYVSQTLNTTLGETFFDHINKYRIRAALPQLAESEDTVMTVAMAVGFNARSSFYKAFKHQTGMTPSAWRKARRAETVRA